MSVAAGQALPASDPALRQVASPVLRHMAALMRIQEVHRFSDLGRVRRLSAEHGLGSSREPTDIPSPKFEAIPDRAVTEVFSTVYLITSL
jgi:hypothetical protein